jgi:hypothetical protein
MSDMPAVAGSGRAPGGAGPGLIRRDDLVATMARSVQKRVTIISAPAGTGKTSLLRAWADQPGQESQIAFITVTALAALGGPQASRPRHREIHRRAGRCRHRHLHLDHNIRDHAVDPPRPRPQRPGPPLTETHPGDPALVPSRSRKSPKPGDAFSPARRRTSERKAGAAEAAFPGWSQMGAFERREIFLRAADVMAKRGEEAIVALARETGAYRLFSQFNVAFCIKVLREAAAAVNRSVGELLPTSILGAYSMAQRIPFGVVGAISPWNAPLVLGIRSIAIPLAVGNTVTMKPSEDAPVTCGLLLADVLTEAGLPPMSGASSGSRQPSISSRPCSSSEGRTR